LPIARRRAKTCGAFLFPVPGAFVIIHFAEILKNSSAFRLENQEGRQYLVVPGVPVREQV